MSAFARACAACSAESIPVQVQKEHRMDKWVYRFDEVDQAEAAAGGDWDEVRGLLGGKGANLGEMSRTGVPVPPGFTITTRACQTGLGCSIS